MEIDDVGQDTETAAETNFRESTRTANECYGKEDFDDWKPYVADEDGPSDPSYNDVFLGLSADLSDTLRTDDVNLVDIHAVSPALAAAIFENGVLLVGEQEHATELRRQLTAAVSEQQSPRERLDTALDRIDAHLDDSDAGVPVTGDAEDDRRRISGGATQQDSDRCRNH